MITAGVVLAAGRSTRFGAQDKLLADLGGRPLVAHAAAAMAAVPLDLRIAVVRTDAAAAQFQGWRIARAAGQHSDSLRAGVAAAREAGAARLLIALGDMPWVTPGLLVRLLAACEDARPAFARQGGHLTPPACFPEILFDALSGISGDRGAGGLRLQSERVIALDAPSESMRDVDTFADLRIDGTPLAAAFGAVEP